jgi:hypothetical protein
VSLAITPSELPLAFPLPPPETPFSKFVQKDVVTVRYLATVFPAYVSERVQPIAVIMVGQKFNRKPSIGIALTNASRTLERSQQRQCFGAFDHGRIIVPSDDWRNIALKIPKSAETDKSGSSENELLTEIDANPNAQRDSTNRQADSHPT